MGSRRIRYITLIILLLLNVTNGYSNVSINIRPPSENTVSLIDKFINGFIAALPGLIIAFIGIGIERKKEKKNLRIQWYNTMILDETLTNIRDYYDFIEKNVQDLNNNVTAIKEEIRALRQKTTFFLDYVKIFDENVFTTCKKMVNDSVDNYTNANIGLSEIKRRNKNYKLVTIKLLYEKANNI